MKSTLKKITEIIMKKWQILWIAYGEIYEISQFVMK